MKIDEFLKPGRILAVTIVPLVLAAIYILAILFARLVRYDPAFFTESYITQYDTPRSVITALEEGLQTGDQELLAELQGLRWPHSFTIGDFYWKACIDQGDGYFSYVYLNMDVPYLELYERRVYHTIYIRGRWIAASSDADFLLRTGRWVWAWVPITTGWWIVEIAMIVSLVVYRSMARFRETLYSRGEPKGTEIPLQE